MKRAIWTNFNFYSVFCRDNELEITLANGKTANQNITNGSLQNGCLSKTISNGNVTNGCLPNENIYDSHFKLVNDNITNQSHANKTTIQNGINRSISVEPMKKIPVYNFTCDLMEKPFTWIDFVKNNEIHEPDLPSSVSVR